MIYQGLKGYPVRELCLHCAAVPSGWYFRRSDAEMVQTIRNWHLEKGWSDIGYHFVIPPNGIPYPGRPMRQIGAGVIGHNRGVLHVLLIEKHEVTKIGKFDDYFTEKQRDAVRALAEINGIRRITGHNDFAAKLCPGFKVKTNYFL